MQVNKHVKHKYLGVNACKLIILSLLYRLHCFFKNKCSTFQIVYSKSNIKLSKEWGWEFKGNIASFTSNTIVNADVT